MSAPPAPPQGAPLPAAAATPQGGRAAPPGAALGGKKAGHPNGRRLRSCSLSRPFTSESACTAGQLPDPSALRWWWRVWLGPRCLPAGRCLLARVASDRSRWWCRYESVRQLRRAEEAAGEAGACALIVGVTSMNRWDLAGMDACMERGLAAGMDAFIARELRMQHLRDTLRKLGLQSKLLETGGSLPRALSGTFHNPLNLSR